MTDYDQVKATVSITDILRRYGYAAPDRSRYQVLCPFHSERTPSLNVDDAKGLFYCFGCAAAGSVVDLVARFDGTTPSQAARRLATDFGISEIDAFRVDARRITSRVNQYQAQSDPSSTFIPHQQRFLSAGYRNLSQQAIDHFRLSLTDEGVCLPHFDLSGELIGYTIRQPDGVQPKYRNSVGFPKGVPYGTFQNQNEIRTRGFAILVEGQIDCVTVWDRGYANVVAIMGSSLTEQQAHLLSRLTTRLVLLFDGDKAGRMGAVRTLRRWEPMFTTKLALLPDGRDPADYLEAA